MNLDVTTDRRRLLEVREEQRRLFAAVPFPLIDDIKWQDAPPDVEPAVPVGLELFVRIRAAEALTDEAATYLDDRAVAAHARYTASALGCLTGWNVRSAASRVVSALRSSPLILNGADTPVNVSILEFAVLAVVADHLADDGYSHPHAPKPVE